MSSVPFSRALVRGD